MTIKPSSRHLLSHFFYRIPHSFLMGILWVIISTIPLAIFYPIYSYTKFGIDEKLPSSPIFWLVLLIVFMILAYIKGFIDTILYVKNTTVTSNKETISVEAGGIHSFNLTYPLQKISSVITEQQLTEKMLGLCTITISGELDENISMDGFDYQAAKEFAVKLLKREQ